MLPIFCGLRETASSGGKEEPHGEYPKGSNCQNQRLPSVARLTTPPNAEVIAIQSECRLSKTAEAVSGLVTGSSGKLHFHIEPSALRVKTMPPLPDTASQFDSLPSWTSCLLTKTSRSGRLVGVDRSCQSVFTLKVPSSRTPTRKPPIRGAKLHATPRHWCPSRYAVRLRIVSASRRSAPSEAADPPS